MARHLFPALVEHLRTVIRSDTFMELAREDKADFTRDRKLTLPDYIFMIVNRLSTSLLGMIRRYTDVVRDVPMCSKQAFSKGRKRIKADALDYLIRVSAEYIQRHASCLKTWKGFRVFAVDGSRINLPDSGESRSYFGFQDQTNEQVQGLLSGLYDVLNRYFLDAELAPCSSNERTLAIGHIAKLRETNADFLPKSIITFDRGYPSAPLIDEIGREGSVHLFYAMRCTEEFIRGMHLTSDDCVLTHQFTKLDHPVRLRIVRFRLKDGRTEIIATNLLSSRFTIQDFMDLYHLRWEIETAYHALKVRMELENYSGILTRGILQDTYGAIVMLNIISALMLDLVRSHPLPKSQKPNFAEILRLVKDRLFHLFRYTSTMRSLVSQLLRQASTYLAPVKFGRSFPRVVRHKSAHFSQNNRGI